MRPQSGKWIAARRYEVRTGEPARAASRSFGAVDGASTYEGQPHETLAVVATNPTGPRLAAR